MDRDYGIAPSPDRARSSSWGGPGARAELRRIADDAGHRAGFRVCSVEVLRGDGLLELVAFTGPGSDELTGMGNSFTISHVRRVLNEGTRYGRFVFLAEEEMDADFQEQSAATATCPPILDSERPRAVAFAGHAGGGVDRRVWPHPRRAAPR